MVWKWMTSLFKINTNPVLKGKIVKEKNQAEQNNEPFMFCLHMWITLTSYVILICRFYLFFFWHVD